jgi:peptidoglycan/xylan/chitin deacetylase (PgdA/CDA1 family)
MRRTILLFWHDIRSGTAEDGLGQANYPTMEQFREQMQFLATHFEVVELSQAIQQVHASGNGRPRVCLTFDDGCAGIMRIAEVLQSLKLPGAFFLSTRFIGTDELPWYHRLDAMLKEAIRQGRSLPIAQATRGLSEPRALARCRQAAASALLARDYDGQQTLLAEWADELKGSLNSFRPPGRAFINWEEARQLAAAGFVIGSHTHSHLRLPAISDSTLESEFTQSVRLLDAHLGTGHARYVAYPGGYVDARVTEVARRYHEKGFATLLNEGPRDPYNVPRRGAGAGGAELLRRVLSRRHVLILDAKRRIRRLLGKESQA